MIVTSCSLDNSSAWLIKSLLIASIDGSILTPIYLAITRMHANAIPLHCSGFVSVEKLM